MQPINGQRTNQPADSDNKGLRNAGCQNGRNDFIIIEILVDIIRYIQQLIQNIGKRLRHFPAYIAAGIFGRNGITYQYQPVYRYSAPFIIDFPLRGQRFDCFFRPIDENRQCFSVFRRYTFVKNHINFGSDHAGGVPQKLTERLIFPMQITEKIFRSFRQTADCA